MKALIILNNYKKFDGFIRDIVSDSFLNEAIKELENIKNNKHLNYTTTADTSSKECCLSLEKRIKHIENTLEEIFRASAYNKDALNKNNSVWNYFKSRR